MLGRAVLGGMMLVVVVTIAAAAIAFVQPKRVVAYYHAVPVLSAEYQDRSSTAGPRAPVPRMNVLLPNGNRHGLEVRDYHVREGFERLCLQEMQGRWWRLASYALA
jgi:hypothetical protein